MAKTWFITDSSSGTGMRIARAVLEKGDNAVIMARDIRKLDEIIQQYPNNVFAVSLELTDKASIRDAVRAANERIAEVFETNLFGPVELIKQILPQMRKRKI